MANLEPAWLAHLRGLNDVVVTTGVPLADRTSFKIGGPAEVLAQPQNATAVAALTSSAAQHGVPVTILGGGTNVLIADRGIPGLVIDLQPGFSFLRESPGSDGSARWEIGAGCGTGRVVNLGIQRGLQGPEVLAGVPGSMGGALIMNAGGHEGEIESMVQRVQVVVDGEVRWLSNEEIGFEYRNTNFPEGAIVLAGEFELRPGDRDGLRARVKAAQARRRATQPLALPNAGSIFKNPDSGPAGRYIEEAGCKGWVEGGAEVSELHANFIVNRQHGSATDVLTLARRVADRVLDSAGVELNLEVKLLGDFGSPHPWGDA